MKDRAFYETLIGKTVVFGTDHSGSNITGKLISVDRRSFTVDVKGYSVPQKLSGENWKIIGTLNPLSLEETDWRALVGQECEGVPMNFPGSVIKGTLELKHLSGEELPYIHSAFVHPDSIKPLSTSPESVPEWEPATIEDVTHVLVGTSYLDIKSDTGDVSIGNWAVRATDLANCGCTFWKRRHEPSPLYWEGRIGIRAGGYYTSPTPYPTEFEDKPVVVLPGKVVDAFVPSVHDSQWLGDDGVSHTIPTGATVIVTKEAE